MPLSPLYTCSRCRKEFNFDNIKYDDNKKLICVDCLHRQKMLEKKSLKAEKPDESQPINFICVSCRFKFSVKKGSPKEVKCPYCGNTRLMHVKKYKDEDDLIRDSMNPKFDY